jgi:hypothetical protein
MSNSSSSLATVSPPSSFPPLCCSSFCSFASASASNAANSVSVLTSGSALNFPSLTIQLNFTPELVSSLTPGHTLVRCDC